MARNASAAAAAVAGGLTSGNAALEQGTRRALRLMGRHAGCARLGALLRGGCLLSGLWCCTDLPPGAYVPACFLWIPRTAWFTLQCCPAEARGDAWGLGSSALTASFERHAGASQAECDAMGRALRRAAGVS